MKASAITLVHKDAPYRELRAKVAADAAASGQPPKTHVPYLVNLVDSPGHVDFSADVSTAVRVCDGAVLVVDVVEGVCIQTHAVLRQAWEDGVVPCLVLNKIDRLITELQMTPAEAYTRMQRVLEHVNVVASSLLTSRQMEAAEEAYATTASADAPAVAAAAAATEPAPGGKASGSAAVGTDAAAAEERKLFFSPSKGNVVFASAHAGWAFSLDDFAGMLAEKLGASQSGLRKHLWGAWAYKKATDEFVATKEGGKRVPLFVDFVLTPIWRTYACAVLRPSQERMQKIIEAFGLNVPEGIVTHSDPQARVRGIMKAWLPLARAVLSMVVRCLPSPAEAQGKRLDVLLGSKDHREGLPGASAAALQRRKALIDAIARCDASDDAPTVVFVTKLLPVPGDTFDSDLTANGSDAMTQSALADLCAAAGLAEDDAAGQLRVSTALDEQALGRWGQLQAAHEFCSEKFMAFGRVFSGTVRPGQRLWLVGEEALPGGEGGVPLCLSQTRAVAVETSVVPFMMMARQVFPVPSMPAGNIVALAGLHLSLVKQATVSSSPLCPAFAEMTSQSTPLLKVTVAPKAVSDLPALQRGLQLLNQADPCVATSVTPDGQLQLAAVGELHLANCVEDLVKRFAQVEVQVSPPVLAFRETITLPSSAAAVQGDGGALATLRLQAAAAAAPAPADDEEDGGAARGRAGNASSSTVVTEVPPAVAAALPVPGAGLEGITRGSASTNVTWDSDAQCMRITASISMEGTSLAVHEARPTVNLWLRLCPVPPGIAAAVQGHGGALAAASGRHSSDGQAAAAEHGAMLTALAALEEAALSEEVMQQDSDWPERAQSLVAAVPSGDCLLCASGVPELVAASSMPGGSAGGALVSDPRVVAALVQGFRLAASSGPLVAEPLHAVCADIVGMSISMPGAAATQPSMSAVVRAVSAAVRAGVHYGVALHAPRLVEPLYRAELQCSGGRSGGGEQLGNLYGVLNKRRGVTESEELVPGTTTFHVVALLPVAESLGFAQDLRAATSGAASAPQMVFSHWSPLTIDPFDAGAGGGDEEAAGLEMSHSASHLRNAARRYMDAARKRKGLRTHDKVVVHAEKQRTLARKK